MYDQGRLEEVMHLDVNRGALRGTNHGARNLKVLAFFRKREHLQARSMLGLGKPFALARFQFEREYPIHHAAARDTVRVGSDALRNLNVIWKSDSAPRLLK